MFVPPSHFLEGFNSIVKLSPLHVSTMLFFTQPNHIKKIGIRRIPNYPIAHLNCFDCVLIEGARTKKSLEAWHTV